MRILKIEAEGITTSFRYPHFMQSIHPTYDMPPPATIYGHICSAVGEWVNPTGLRFAYHFTVAGQVVDLEHIIVLSRGKGTLPGTDGLPSALEGGVNPFSRHLLFRPKLVLYLNRPEWQQAFRSPRYAVVLGRSQDLFTYTRVTTLELAEAEKAYLEHTLLPYEMATCTDRGYTVLMPRYLDYEDGRRPTFAQYLVLQDRVTTTNLRRYGSTDRQLWWVDPESESVDGTQRGLVFHSFVGETHEAIGMA
jgi:CRISPR-associated protein Cas5t